MLVSVFSRHPRARMWVTVFSCMGVLMSLSAISYFGAILNYLYSFYQTNKPSLLYFDPFWMITWYQVTAPVGMIVGSPLVSKYLGNANAVTFFVIINAAAAFAGYYTIREPLALLATYGLIQGFCSGALFNLVWKICLEQCATAVSGTATGIMGAGTPLGALAISELSLLVVNPGNQKRSGQAGNMHFFSDPVLLERIPYMFVMNGIFCVAVHFTSALFLNLADRAGKKMPLNEDDSTGDGGRIEGIEKSLERGDNIAYGTFTEEQDFKQTSTSRSGTPKHFEHDPSKAPLKSCLAKHSKELNINSNRRPDLKDRSISFHASLNEEFIGSVRVTESNNDGISTRDMIKTCTFWNLWFINLTLNVGLYIYMNLYKEFGAHYFNNDLLLTNAGVLAYVCMIITRPLFGFLVDRQGVKAGLLLLTSTSTVFILLTMVSLYYSQPIGYVVTVVGEINSISMLWLVFNYAAKDSFGPAFYSSNSGIIFTAMIPPYIVCAAVLPYLVSNFGMMTVFLIAAICCGLSFFLSLFYYDNDRPFK